MSDDEYDNAFGTDTEGMKTERMEMTVDIYESADHMRDHDFRTDTNTHQSLQRSGSDSVKSRSSRAAVVGLVLLCVLLLTAVIVLCVYIYTNNINTEETKLLLTKMTNLTEERDRLLTKMTKLTEEKDGLTIKNTNLLNKRDKLINQLSIPGKDREWIYYQFSFYYMSKETKNWTESRQDCQKRGADLIIINNREEQNFFVKITNKTEFWIGVTDAKEEGRWKWVDGSNLTSSFWASSGAAENCAVTYFKNYPDVTGWHDDKCQSDHQWLCEKNISSLIQP